MYIPHKFSNGVDEKQLLKLNDGQHTCRILTKGNPHGTQQNSTWEAHLSSERQDPNWKKNSIQTHRSWPHRCEWTYTPYLKEPSKRIRGTCLLCGMGALTIGGKEIKMLDAYHRGLLWMLQTLPEPHPSLPLTYYWAAHQHRPYCTIRCWPMQA